MSDSEVSVPLVLLFTNGLTGISTKLLDPKAKEKKEKRKDKEQNNSLQVFGEWHGVEACLCCLAYLLTYLRFQLSLNLKICQRWNVMVFFILFWEAIPPQASVWFSRFLIIGRRFAKPLVSKDSHSPSCYPFFLCVPPLSQFFFFDPVDRGSFFWPCVL